MTKLQQMHRLPVPPGGALSSWLKENQVDFQEETGNMFYDSSIHPDLHLLLSLVLNKNNT